MKVNVYNGRKEMVKNVFMANMDIFFFFIRENIIFSSEKNGGKVVLVENLLMSSFLLGMKYEISFV